MKLRTANFPTSIINRLSRGFSNKRFAEYFITFICIITLNFFLPRLMPGDPFLFLAGNNDEVTITYSEEQIEKYKAYYGLDKPLSSQYISYLTSLLQGDIGYSIYYNEEVSSLVGKRAVWTIALVIVSLSLSSVIGTILGCISAGYRDSYFDRSLYILMVSLSEIPAFLIGLVLLFSLGAGLGWFPLAGGMSTFIVFEAPLDQVLDIIHHAALPILTLMFARLGDFYMISRSSMLTILSKDYMRTARGKGLKKKRILFGHALRNAIIPIVTRLFLSLGTVFGGAILVENVFNYPGLGILMREAVMLRDYTLVQGVFLFFTISVLLMNFLADMLYKKLDPRIT